MKTLIYPEANITYLYNGIQIPNCAPLNNDTIQKNSPNASVDFGKKILSVQYCEYDLNFNKQISINAVDLKGWTIICDFGMNVFTSSDLTIKRMDTGETYIFEDNSNIKIKNYNIPGYDHIDRDIHNYRIIKHETYNNKVKYSFTTNWKDKYCEHASSSYNYGVSDKDILYNTHVNSLGIFRVFEEFTFNSYGNIVKVENHTGVMFDFTKRYKNLPDNVNMKITGMYAELFNFDKHGRYLSIHHDITYYDTYTVVSDENETVLLFKHDGKYKTFKCVETKKLYNTYDKSGNSIDECYKISSGDANRLEDTVFKMIIANNQDYTYTSKKKPGEVDEDGNIITNIIYEQTRGDDYGSVRITLPPRYKHVIDYTYDKFNDLKTVIFNLHDSSPQIYDYTYSLGEPS